MESRSKRERERKKTGRRESMEENLGMEKERKEGVKGFGRQEKQKEAEEVQEGGGESGCEDGNQE